MISVAITTYNSSSFIDKALENLDDELISEIIINDDHSDDYELLFEKISNFKNNKIKLSCNQKNIGSFFNKVETIKKCSNDWVILLDSDNSLHKEYLEALRKEIPWRRGNLYCAEQAGKNFNYSKFKNKLHTKMTLKGELEDPLFRTFLNTGNFFFNKQTMLNALKQELLLKDPNASCSIYLNYLWLNNWGAIKIVEGMSYFHRVDYESHWVKNATKAMEIADKIMEEMKSW